MKILQFTPSSLNKAPDKISPDRTPAGSGADFASALKAASSRFTTPSAGPGGTVSSENQRALRLPSPGDLGRAGHLLQRLDADIRASSPEALKNVHSLEGLIYVYSKAGG